MQRPSSTTNSFDTICTPTSPRAIASSVWNQYFPFDHHIGLPSDPPRPKRLILIEETDGRYQASLTFRDCFLQENIWSTILKPYNLLKPDLNVIHLNYTSLISLSCIEIPDFASVLQENATQILATLGIALCLIRQQLYIQQYDQIHDIYGHGEVLSSNKTIGFLRSKIIVRLINVLPFVPISSIKANVLNQLVSVRGTVVRVSSITSRVIRCEFVCEKCTNITLVTFTEGQYEQPNHCEATGCRSKSLQPRRATVETIDCQKIKLQELNETDETQIQVLGTVPRMVEVELSETDLVDSCIPGNVVTIAGIVKSMNSEIAAGRYGKRAQANSLHILYIDAISVENLTASTSNITVLETKDEAVKGEFTKTELEAISNLIHSPHCVFDRLVHSLCPGIYRHEMVKAGLILALLGGTRTENSDIESTNKVNENENTEEEENTTTKSTISRPGKKEKDVCERRSDSHVLIVGDPGLGKSQMLRAVVSVAPRAVYIGGNTTTTTGLTVTMVKDTAGDYALEAGALVLSDQGVCCIDEFDKMGIDYHALLEAMEQQSISIAKAGIVCTLNARTSVIAAANPSGGHYDRSKSIGENIKLKGALLSRFDLIFLLTDDPDEERDRLLSEHVLRQHSTGSKKNLKKQKLNATSSRLQEQDESESESASHQLSFRLRENASYYTQHAIPTNILKKFIAYARKYVHPKLSKEAAAVLQEKYLTLRSAGGTDDYGGRNIPVTTRQLESLIRLSQARAKAEFSSVVTAQHARDVVEILAECLLDSYTTEDGSLDLGRSGGMSLAKKVKSYVSRLLQITKRRDSVLYTVEELAEIAQSMRLQVDDFRDFLDILRNECYILKKGPNLYKVQVATY